MALLMWWSAWKAATCGCSCQPSLPLAKMGEASGASCWTTITGTPAARAAAMAWTMFGSEMSTDGYSMGMSPVKYSFCTSMTSRARRGAVVLDMHDS
ncbi:hypothetical protein D3C87_1920280 [compost metagenome]